MDMTRHFLPLAVLPILLAGCMTHIVTVAPAVVDKTTYTTTVTTPKIKTVTTTKVTALNEDISLHLDLKAVAAAFAQAATVQEFEQLLNNSSYMLSNLDLNGDGYIDYLRVLETIEGHTHVFLIQAVLAANIYQDVATLVAEVSGKTAAYVQVIGSTYIYGPQYIIQPVYVVTPPIFAHLCVVNYKAWRSPWYWNHYPTCYHHPAPTYLSHYQAYVHTYMTNHHYCHEVTYTSVCHYPDYDRVTRSSQRNDYGHQYPERTFTVRNANIPSGGSTRTATAAVPAATRNANARDVQERQAANVTSTTTTRSGASSATRTAATTTTTPRTAAQPQSSTRTASSAPATTATRSTATTAKQTTVSSRVAKSGSTDTRTKTVSASGQTTTVRRNATAAPAARSASATTSTRTAATGSSRR